MAPLVNERISETLWNTTIRQAGGLVEHQARTDASEKTLACDSTLPEDVRKLAFNCLQATSYGLERPWTSRAEPVPKGHAMSFSTALEVIADNLILSAFLSIKTASLPLMPHLIRKIGTAKLEFVSHVEKMLQRHRDSMISRSASDKSNVPNIMDFMVDESDKVKDENSRGRLHLSEQEILGNMFQVTVAGYETSANALTYAIALLAVHPDVQDWLYEEINEVRAEGSTKGPVYAETYARLPRCLALMVSLNLSRSVDRHESVSRISVADAALSTKHSASTLPSCT